MADLSVTGEVVVNSEQAEGAFNRVGDKAQQMANEVATSAGRAGQAVDKIGDGAGASADKFTRAEARMRDAIKKSTQELQLLGKTASEKLEFNIQTKGLDATKFAPYIAELKQAEAAQRIATGSLDKMGVSAAQTAAALRGVPAQFTDIITSLQGGQAPLTVFLQQGGQLKDMFGGAGNAAKALGGYVLGLVNPFTVVAGAAVALAIAYKQGSAEADAYNRSIALTGNAAGTTATQLQQMAARISSSVGTQGAAAEALAQLVGSGRVAAENLEQFGETAVRLERTAGIAIKETVKDFAELGKAPVEASKKLNDSYNYLTAAVFEQIKALEGQGRALEAASVAQQAYDRAMNNVAATLQGQLGYIERAWRGLGDAAKIAWDKMLNVGRPDTLATQLEAARANLEQRLNTPLAVDNEAMRASRQKGIDSLRNEINLLTEQERMMRRGAEAQAQRTQAEKDGIAAAEALQKTQDKGLSKQEQMNKALAEYRKQLADLRAVNPNSDRLSSAAISRGESAIRDQFKEKGGGAPGVGEGEVANIRARTVELERYLDVLRSHGAAAEKMTESEKLVIKIQEKLKTSISGTARAQKEKALAEAQGQVSVERQVESEKARIKALKESEAALNSQIDAMRRQADSVLEQATAQEAVNANMGKSKTATEQAVLAQLKLQQAESESSDRFAPAYVAALAAKTSAQERFVQALQQAEYLQKGAKLDEAGRVAAEETASLELQISLIGRSQFEREKIIAQRQIEVRLAKELAEIEKLNLGEGPEAEAKRAELRARAAANAVVEGNNAASKSVLDEWQRTADSINNSLTDALLRGFESGKSFAANLRDTLVNMFKTLVLRPVISFIVNPISGAISSAIGGVVNSGLSMLGMGSNLLGGGGSILGNIGSAVGGWLGLGGAATGLGLSAGVGGSIIGAGIGSGLGVGAGAAATGSGLGLSLGGTGLGIGAGSAGAGSIGAGIGSSISGGAAGAGGISGALAAVPGWGWALAAVAVLASLADSGETRIGGQFGVAYDGEVDNNRRGQTYNYEGQQYDRDFSNGERNPLVDGQAYRLEGDPVENEQLIRQAVSGTAMGITEMLKALGSSLTVTGFSAGLETSGKGRGGVFAGGTLSDGTTFGESGTGDNYAGTLYELTSTNSPDYETALKNFTLDLKQSTIQALQAAGDIPESVKKMIEDVDAEALTDEAANALLTSINAQITGVTNFRSALDQMGLTDFADMAYDTAVAIAEASGGFEQLQSNLTSFYQNYYTEEERRANTQATIEEKFKALGLTMPKTREEFRALVEELMAMGEAGAAALAVVLGLAGAFASITDGAQSAADALGITADGLASIMSDAVMNSSSRGEAEQKASQGFETMFYEGILNTMTSALSEGLMSAVLGPLLNGLVGGAIASGTALAVGGAAGGGAVAAGGAMGGGAVAAGGSAAGGAVAAGGMQAGAAMAAGGEAAGGRVTDFITSAREYINQFMAVLKDPGVQGAIGEFAGIFGNITGDLYAGMNTFFINSKSMPAVGGSLSSAMGGVKNSMQDLTDSLVEEVKRIRGLIEEGAEANFSLAALKSQFAIATAQARAGDKEAAAKLPELSQRMLELAEKNASSSAELRLIQATTAASLQATAEALVKKYGGKLPSFAVGTNEIPFDMVAQVHQGERIIPAADNRALIGAIQRNGTADDSQAAMQGMDARFQKMQEHLADIERNTKRLDDVISNWSRNGAPVVNQEGTTLETTP